MNGMFQLRWTARAVTVGANDVAATPTSGTAFVRDEATVRTLFPLLAGDPNVLRLCVINPDGEAGDVFERKAA